MENIGTYRHKLEEKIENIKERIPETDKARDMVTLAVSKV